MISTKMRKAVSWLNINCKTILPITGKDIRGQLIYSYYLFKFKREGKKSVWYLLKMTDDFYGESVKRICLY